MGQSATSYLFYGYAWPGEIDDEQDPEGFLSGQAETEWPEAVAISRGIVNPWDARQEGEDAKRFADEHRVELEAWYAEKRKIEKEVGCDLGWHCSSDYPIPYVYVTSTRITTYQGDATAVGFLNAPEDADEKLAAFLKLLEVEPPEDQQPAWRLVVNYG